MSEWNRDRQEPGGQGGQRRYDDGSSWLGEGRATGERHRNEQRSFGGDRGQGFGGSGGYRQAYGPSRADEAQGYGQEDRGFGAGRQPYAEPGYGSQGYRGQQGGQGDQFTGRNEPVREVTDGKADHGVFGMFGRDDHGRGEHRGRGPKNYTRSDERIREDVNDRLTHDSRIDASEIDVQVSQCEVTLTGTVSSREDKRTAEDIVDHVSGVKHVQNNLRVQQPGMASGTQPGAGQSGATRT